MNEQEFFSLSPLQQKKERVIYKDSQLIHIF